MKEERNPVKYYSRVALLNCQASTTSRVTSISFFLKSNELHNKNNLQMKNRINII